MSSLPSARIDHAPLRLVNPDAGHPKPTLVPPTMRGYIYVAAAVNPAGIPIVLPDAHRSNLLTRLRGLARQIAGLEDVVSVDLFRAIVRPPTASFSPYLKERGPSVRIANFDTALLIQTASPAAVRTVQANSVFQILNQVVHHEAKNVYIMPARNVRRIGDVDTKNDRLFLFNHFVADDAEVMLELWEYLAGWYVHETGLRNSVALMPSTHEPSDYTLVNWASWNVNPIRHFWHQLSKRGFWRYVTRNLDEHRAASMPLYCRLVASFAGRMEHEARGIRNPR
jgi:hypothetical protein